ncbi:unnamed protein product [Phytophthora fragariaefolia]|uniref:Unnamed protein product n=1 Tax=Phytophthora fragariaefolia TaxID=1490495 RepID=A0A9W6XXW7_9STRA|nr:unnamed protein product [Phytophthora fragariaefolia]
MEFKYKPTGDCSVEDELTEHGCLGAGIGKSVFLAYFLERYGVDNQCTTIITASFESDGERSIRKRVVVWKNGKAIGKAANIDTEMRRSHPEDYEKREEKKKVIILYDGPPTSLVANAQMVCFTSPNERWLNKLKTSEDRPILIMPLWYLEELPTACESLAMRVPLRNETLWEEGTNATSTTDMVADHLQERFAIFGGVARECLSIDSAFEARRLHGDDTAQLNLFKCRPSLNGGVHCCFENDFTSLELRSDSYHVPGPKKFASIDSFYYRKASSDSTPISNDQPLLLLFQITVAHSHPVNGEGLVDTLQRLGLLEMAKQNPARVALIFVVPVENAPGFEAQKVELDASNDEDRVDNMDGVGKKRATSLSDIGIYTIGALRRLLEQEAAKKTERAAQLANSPSFQTLIRPIPHHDAKQGWPGMKNVLNSIPQFVCGGPR